MTRFSRRSEFLSSAVKLAFLYFLGSAAYGAGISRNDFPNLGSPPYMNLAEIELPKSMIGPPYVAALQKEYGCMRISTGPETVSINLVGCSEKETLDALWDLEFRRLNPSVEAENMTSRMDNYELRTKTHENLWNHFSHLARMEQNQPKGIYLWGNPGVGKSRLVIALGKEALRQGKRVLYMKIGTSERRGLPSAYALEAGFENYDMILLDDFGMGYGPIENGFLDTALNKLRNPNRLVIFTSNLSPTQFQTRYGIEGLPQYFEALTAEGDSIRFSDAWFNQPNLNADLPKRTRVVAELAAAKPKIGIPIALMSPGVLAEMKKNYSQVSWTRGAREIQLDASLLSSDDRARLYEDIAFFRQTLVFPRKVFLRVFRVISLARKYIATPLSGPLGWSTTTDLVQVVWFSMGLPGQGKVIWRPPLPRPFLYRV